jgi:hypothetical protein
LVRAQPVKSFSEWPKVEGFKSLTPLEESERRPSAEEAVISKRKLAAGNRIPTFTSSKLEAVNLKVGNRKG